MEKRVTAAWVFFGGDRDRLQLVKIGWGLLGTAVGRRTCIAFLLLFLNMSFFAAGQSNDSYPFISKPLTEQGDLSALMVAGIDRFLVKETERVAQSRNRLWHWDFSDTASFNRSVLLNRASLSHILGLSDERLKPGLQVMTGARLDPYIWATASYTVRAVRWRVLEGMNAEGLLLEPKGKLRAGVVVIPDADIAPEVLAGMQQPGAPGYGVAGQLAAAGCEVLVPVLVSREDSFSGNSSLKIYTNQPHREWIYRQGYEVGRSVIGYELQKIFSAIDWLESKNKKAGSSLPMGVAGYGEGGLLALYAAALDTRIASTLVSGYFDAREQLWQEPIYRNVFGVLKYFGDAELAVMAWPRPLVVEASKGPERTGPPAAVKGRSGAAPGSLHTPAFASAKSEWDRAVSKLPSNKIHLRWCTTDSSVVARPFSAPALREFTQALGISTLLAIRAQKPVIKNDWVDAVQQQERTVKEMEQRVQKEIILGEWTRNKNFWQQLKGDTTQQRPVKAVLREQFWEQLGKLPAPDMPANPRARLLQKTARWTSYELMLDVWPGVFAWGILIIPNNLQAGEQRPVIVCQHGLEGVPADVVTTDPQAENYHYYKGFASRLADSGYIIFAPSHLYRGGDKFRVLQRKANPVGLSLFSVMIGQHQRIVEWLKQQSFVDPKRIGFYGLSYGGKSAMRIPAVVEDYAFSICSADFNEWVRKSTSTDYSFSYLFTGEYEMQEWDLGHTFNYAEMAALIAPRPFMVERGHYDNVATDEWVGYEFEKVRRHYDLLGLPNAARIEYFTGPHTINGVGSFEFIGQMMKGIYKIQQAVHQ
ncbi:MAG: prolyl oligopeptidase family serine peptidase [Chitinophagaceae bacterium]